MAFLVDLILSTIIYIAQWHVTYIFNFTDQFIIWLYNEHKNRDIYIDNDVLNTFA